MFFQQKKLENQYGSLSIFIKMLVFKKKQKAGFMLVSSLFRPGPGDPRNEQETRKNNEHETSFFGGFSHFFDPALGPLPTSMNET